jgi:glycolate oxidase
MLLLEIDGDEGNVETQAQRVLDACDQAGALEGLVAQSSSQRDRLWAARRDMSHTLRRLAKHKLSEDIVVPRTRLPELFERIKRISEQRQLQMPAYGHAGDGNIHVNFLWDTPDQKHRVDGAIEDLFKATLELGGTLSGEHGIGVLKAPYLELEQSQELIALQQNLKAVFDPHGLLNPGKIFKGRGHGPC